MLFALNSRSQPRVSGLYMWGMLHSDILLLLEKGVISSPPLNVTFVTGIMGHFIQCDDEQKQKSGIKREGEKQTSELIKNTIGPCVFVCVCVLYFI